MKNDPAKAEAVKKLAATAARAITAACAPLGLMQADSHTYWERTRARRLRLRGLDANTIDAKVTERADARKIKGLRASRRHPQRARRAWSRDLRRHEHLTTWKVTL